MTPEKIWAAVFWNFQINRRKLIFLHMLKLTTKKRANIDVVINSAKIKGKP